jgi:hypothetical protein
MHTRHTKACRVACFTNTTRKQLGREPKYIVLHTSLKNLAGSHDEACAHTHKNIPWQAWHAKVLTPIEVIIRNRALGQLWALANQDLRSCRQLLSLGVCLCGLAGKGIFISGWAKPIALA